jgi:hypothetical protein
MTKKSDLTQSFQKLLTFIIQVQMTWNFFHTYIPIRSIRSQSYRLNHTYLIIELNVWYLDY